MFTQACAPFPHSAGLWAEILEYSGYSVPSIRRENIKDVPKRTEIPGTLLCGSFKVAAGKGKGERVAVASGSGSNYRTVSILSHLTAARNTHHSSHHGPTDQINSRADKGRAQKQAQEPRGPQPYLFHPQRMSFVHPDACPLTRTVPL